MTEKKNIGVVANNLNAGNPFFELSIINDLRKVYGGAANVFPIEGRNVFFTNKLAGTPVRTFEYGVYSQLDWLVYSGPIFKKGIITTHRRLLDEVVGRGRAKLVLISAGASQYSKEETTSVRAFLAEYKPYLISTRDAAAYEIYSDLAPYSYSGICSAFYSSAHYSGYDTPALGDYITVSFETWREPRLPRLRDGDVQEALNQLRNQQYRKCPTSKLERLFDWLRSYPDAVGSLRIIRPLHDMVPTIYSICYRRPNRFQSTNPYSYLNLYRNTKLTLSDRVHACVATLAYGNQAMLLCETERARLFERVGARNIQSQPVSVSQNVIDEEHRKFLEFLAGVPL